MFGAYGDVLNVFQYNFSDHTILNSHIMILVNSYKHNKNTKVLIIYSVIFYSLFFSAWFFGSKLVLIEKKLTKFEEN